MAPVLRLTEAPEHPHVMARGAFVTDAGPLQPAPAPKLSGTPLRPGPAAPPRGHHTSEILGELGRSPDEIVTLLASGAAYEESRSPTATSRAQR